MNERIKELANIAAGRSIKTSPALASDMADWAVIEKFTELIVRECAEVALQEEHDPSDCILGHFGLKR